MDKILKNIVKFSCELKYEDIPNDVIEFTKKIFIDTLACSFGAMNCKEVGIAKKLTSTQVISNTFTGRILGSKKHICADNAAFANTCMIRNLDFNDAFPGGHPSDMIGAFFTIAPTLGISGNQLILATVIAYEIFINHMSAGNPNKNGFDQGCAISMATAAGLSRILNLSPSQTAHAISISTVSNMQLRVTRSGQLSMWKGCATAHAIRNAMFAVNLALEGMTGPDEPFVGRDGLTAHYQKPFQWELLDKNKKNFHITRVNLKYWPVAYQMQAAVWCGIKLRPKIQSENIVKLIVEANSFAVFESGSEDEKWHPQTKETADHSLPYILAWSLKHGEINFNAFKPQAYSSKEIHKLIKKVNVKVSKEMDSKYPEQSHMRVIAFDKRNNEYVSEMLNPIGHWMNPMTFKDVSEKFKRLTAYIININRAEEIIDAWKKIETFKNTESVFNMLVI